MSFGFSVGDFITAIQIANKIRREFVNAPSQFNAISDEIRSLSIVLQDADITVSGQELSCERKRDLEDIDNSCRNIFDELQRIIDANSELGSERLSTGKKIKRVWKRFKWDPQQVQELRSRIITNIGLLNAINGRLTRDSVIKLVRYQEDQGRQAVLDWITSTDYTSQQHDFISRRQAGTGQWLLDSTEFQTWLNTEGLTMFCPGIPGAGKTILAAVVIEELTTLFSDVSNVGIAYIFFNFRQDDEQTIKELLASLLKQLSECQASLPSSAKDLYSRHKTNRTRPSQSEISVSLQSVLKMYSRVFFVIDALDECVSSNGTRREFLSEISTFQAKYGVNILVTSRFIPEVTQKFEQAIKLEIRASSEDVRSYLSGHMFRLPGFVIRSPELQEAIKSMIVRSVQGMFLLAQLQLDSLVGKRSVKMVRNALANLPTGSMAYDRAYSDAMDRINGQVEDKQELAKQVLSWLTCARRPLTTVELQHALGVEFGSSELDEDNLPEIEDIVSVCAGLVTVDEQSNIIRLVHYTTKEYFDRTQSNWFPDVETNMTTTCISYLSFSVFASGFCLTDDEFEERVRSNPFFDYAARYWGYHARKLLLLNQPLKEIFNSFFENQSKVDALSQGMLAVKYHSAHTDYSQDVPKRVTGLHLATYFGIEVVTKLLIDTCTLSVDSRDSDGRTPLFCAAENGHKTVVQLLLNTNKVDVNCTDNDGLTPLFWAVIKEHKAVLQLLVDTGKADINCKDKEGLTPLLCATIKGREEAVQLLLDTAKVDIECKDGDGLTPLLWAALIEHEGIIKRLLATNKADVNSRDKYDQTPLLYVASSGHKAIAQMLLDSDKVDIKCKDSEGSTPLSCAANNGHEAVVQLLLNTRKVDIECRDNCGRTPLLSAVVNRHKGVVQLLLDTKVDVNCKDEYSQTPLFCAVINGDASIVQLLLDNINVNINYKDIEHRTPLLWAAMNGDKAIVQLLLNAGKVEVNSGDRNGLTPLSWAARRKSKATAQLLLVTGNADINCEDNYGRTPLSWAAQIGSEDIVQLMLERGANPESKCSVGRTPLWWAARAGNKSVKLLLATKSVDVDSKDFYNLTPLSVAARMGHEEVVALLLTRSQCFNARDIFGRTALWWARRTGNYRIAELLLEKIKENGIDIQGNDVPNRNILASGRIICDSCVLGLSDEETFYSCAVCNGGDFDICQECFSLNAHCLDESHNLKPQHLGDIDAMGNILKRTFHSSEAL